MIIDLPRGKELIQAFLGGIATGIKELFTFLPGLLKDIYRTIVSYFS